MRKPSPSAIVLSLLCLSASLLSSRGQVILNPNQISGNVSFNNFNPGVLIGLQAPGNEGMSNIIVQASSLPPAPPIVATTGYLPVNTRLDADYEITVDSDITGISYSVSPRILMQGDRYVYYFANKTSAPVTIGSTPPALDFEECVGVVTVKFVAAGGTPLAVDGGFINAYSLPDMNYSGQRSGIPSGATQQTIYLRGGQSHRLDITVNRGTNFYTDRIESFLMTNVVATCDGFTFIEMVIPSAGTLATVSGNVDMIGEFENTSPGNPLLDAPAYTSVIARSGPFGNQRWGALPGVNFTTPSSGPFTLTNVVPSTLDPLSSGYTLFAQMVVRTNRNIEIFHTPALNAGLNPPLAVTPGATVNLSNLFVINPGYLRGNVLLQGPAESLGQTSMLRGLLHAGDDDADDDGIPDAIGVYGIYNSTVQAVGVDRLASGATFTAASGLGYGDFPGAFNPATSAYEGQYELVLGGLQGLRSIWKQKHLTLVLSSGAVTNDNDYFYNALTVTEVGTNDVEIIPTQGATNDVAYCLSEVKVVFRTTSGAFHSPSFRTSYGAFTGTDFLGRAANYTVAVGPMFGSPYTEATATNIGQVIMYLPEGTYTLYPTVSQSGGETGLQPIAVNVGCGQRIALEPCLQLTLNAPDCTNNSLVQISGSVLSCTNEVASITYTLNGGAPQTICTDCGTDPTFAFNLNLATECTNNILTVTATNDIGGVSSITTAIHYDVTPPDIQCPTNLTVSACDTNGAVVNYAVTTSDNCSGPVTLVCTPPSGSVFPVGVTLVTCIATDECGNTNQCTFTVNVAPGSDLSIERAVIIRWSCGVLQSADEATGPWTDVLGATSPFCTPTSEQKKFYRVRN